MAEPGGAGLDRLLTPRRVLAAVGALVLLTLLIAPWPTADDVAVSPSSYSAAPAGARGLFEVLERLGYPVDRRLSPMRERLDSAAVYVVLEPRVPLTAVEVSRLLDAVRAGAGLLVAPVPDSRLADSLGVDPTPVLAAEPGPDGPRAYEPGTAFGQGWVRRVLRPADPPRGDTSIWRPSQGTTLHRLRTQRGVEPTAVGLRIGAGRVVVVAEAGPFRNAILREGEAGVRAIRLIEWLGPLGVRPITFDEYHHGHGMHADVMREAGRALADTAPGRVVAQIAAAALLLLLAVGVRPVKPRPRTRIERRSPLEHVGALAHAYAEARASRRAAQLLVRGLMRRHRGASSGRDELAFLRAITEHGLATATDVAVVNAALEASDPPDPAQLTAALIRIEQALSR